VGVAEVVGAQIANPAPPVASPVHPVELSRAEEIRRQRQLTEQQDEKFRNQIEKVGLIGAGVVAVCVVIYLISAKGMESRLGWPYWDGRESVAEYARRAGLPATKEVNLSGERMQLVLIPAGKYTMGSPATEKKQNDNETQHEVTLSEPFYMGKYEVTQGQWQAVMGSNPSGFKGSNNPVERVSWDDIQGFMRQAGNGLKLPTEAQWEWACRAGTKTQFHTVGLFSWDSDADLGRAGWYYTGADSTSTRSVGQKQANAFGLYDMHGNVMEWCADWHGDYPAGAAKDPAGPASGTASRPYRVLRGGSWYGNPGFCRSASRLGSSPDYRINFIGFRVVVRISSRTP